MSKYNTNLAAEFYVLSTLYRLGIDAYLTLGNKKSVDIIVLNSQHEIITVDVKGLVDPYDWPANNITLEAKGHFYALVCYEGKMVDPLVSPSSWIVPALKINKFINTYGDRSVVSRSLIRKNGGDFKENWEVLR